MADTRIHWGAFWVSIALVSGCGSGDGAQAQPVSESRVVSRAGVDFREEATTAERFGLEKPAKPASSPHADEASPFAWRCPPGWTEVAPTSMRAANFKPAGDPHAECYLTLLGGDGGGLGANINRWRTQLALPALPPSEIDALPKAPFLGRAAVLLEATGTWKGMNGTESAPGWGITGLLLVEPGGSAFLKMTGPAKLVEAERAAFLALAKSFRAARATEEAKTKEEFAWTLPDGWREAPAKPMRAVTFFAGPGEELECYVTVFPGEAGGVLLNVNRWRGQLDLPEITEVDVERLETVPMLGRKAYIVECEGKGSQLAAAACPGSDRSVFVKMSGPPELVKEQRGAFLAFCMSLEERK